jgi:hypothetical protein
MSSVAQAPVYVVQTLRYTAAKMTVPWIDDLHIPLHFSLFPNTVLSFIPQQLASYSFHINVGSDKHWITFPATKFSVDFM